MNTLWQDITYKIRSGSKLYLLISINVAVFLLINVPAVFEWLFTGAAEGIVRSYANEYLQMPAYLPKLAIRFWTPVTYMFMHNGILHILFNMLWLYWLGQIFEEYLGHKRIVGLYILGGLTGALFYLLSYNLFPVFASSLMISTVAGASASVMAIIVGTATIVPDYTISLIFIGPVKLKWLVLFYVIIDFLSITGPNAGGEIAHIGGALAGFLYIKRLQSGHDVISAVNGIFNRGPKLSKLKVAARNSGRKASSKPQQEDVDKILDKISVHGYESLSKEEKEILFRASKNES